MERKTSILSGFGNVPSYEIRSGNMVDLCNLPRWLQRFTGRNYIYVGSDLLRDENFSGYAQWFDFYEAPYITRYGEWIVVIQAKNMNTKTFRVPKSPIDWIQYPSLEFLTNDSWSYETVGKGDKRFRYKVDRLKKTGLWQARLKLMPRDSLRK